MDNKFFHPYLTYNAWIDAGFEGTFSLKFDVAITHTHHSQYLKDVILTGTKDSGARVNGFDNDITGNDGINTVIFSGNYAEYTIDASSSGRIHREASRNCSLPIRRLRCKEGSHLHVFFRINNSLLLFYEFPIMLEHKMVQINPPFAGSQK